MAKTKANKVPPAFAGLTNGAVTTADKLKALYGKLSGAADEVAVMTAESDLDKQYKLKTVVFVFNARTCTFSKTVSAAEALATGVLNGDSGASPDAIGMSKKMIDKKALAEINNHKQRFRDYCISRSIPCRYLGSSLFLIPVAFSEEVWQNFKQFRLERAQLAASFLENYEGLKESARVSLGPLFQDAQFPDFERLAESFMTQASFLAFDAPAALQAYSQEMWADAKQRMNVAFMEVESEATAAYKAMLVEWAGWLEDRLLSDGTKRKGIEAGKLEALQDFLTMFEQRNITGNEELSGTVAKMKALICGHDVGSLRESQDLRSALGAQLHGIKEGMASWVVDRKRSALGEDIL